MQPNGGLLIAAILVLAIASGFKRDDRAGEAAHGGALSPPRPQRHGHSAMTTLTLSGESSDNVEDDHNVPR